MSTRIGSVICHFALSRELLAEFGTLWCVQIVLTTDDQHSTMLNSIEFCATYENTWVLQPIQHAGSLTTVPKLRLLTSAVAVTWIFNVKTTVLATFRLLSSIIDVTSSLDADLSLSFWDSRQFIECFCCSLIDKVFRNWYWHCKPSYNRQSAYDMCIGTKNKKQTLTPQLWMRLICFGQWQMVTIRKIVYRNGTIWFANFL